MRQENGFLLYERKNMHYRTCKDRITDFNEFYLPLDDEERKKQASRCMDCGTPFCHMGFVIDGLASGCPLNNLIPEWNTLISKGLYKEAYYRLIKTNCFPEFTGRICPALCEGSCTLGGTGFLQVTVRNNEYSIIEKAFKEGWAKPKLPKARTGKKTAIIGSGPAGLACAWLLNQYGHQVTVYEKADRPGGLLMYGIPNMKLDKKIVLRRIELLKNEGIEFKLNTEIGKDIPAEDIIKEYNAVVVCTGSDTPRDLKIEGRNLSGILFAVDYLSMNTKSLLDTKEPYNGEFSAKNKDVIVIGGGDTGNDCVGTAIRQKCKSIVQFEIMPEAKEERDVSNPWPQWPKVKKTDYGQEECIFCFGKDPRNYLLSTVKFEGDTSGNVFKAHTVNIKWEKDSNGKYNIVEIPGTKKAWDAQLVLIAMGFTGPSQSVFDSFGFNKDNRSNIQTNLDSFASNIKGVFAAGDARRGQSLIVHAINEGLKAAKECSEYLNGN